jgi:hypothetical protein
MERPILFSGSMVRAILAGEKTQTRRVIKPQPPQDLTWGGWIVSTTGDNKEIGCAEWDDFDRGLVTKSHTVRCPYGQPGDRLWVRETWATGWFANGTPPRDLPKETRVYYRATPGPVREDHYKWRPSIHMPRWASRITLEVTGIRAERLQAITEPDAVAEGVPVITDPECPPPAFRFRALWDSINAQRGFAWGGDPWVWVVEFRKVI